MKTVRGIMRATVTREVEGTADDTAAARATAIASIDMDSYPLIQTGTVTAVGGQITVHAVTCATATRDHAATGPTHDAAMQAFRSPVPNGWQAVLARTIDYAPRQARRPLPSPVMRPRTT